MIAVDSLVTRGTKYQRRRTRGDMILVVDCINEVVTCGIAWGHKSVGSVRDDTFFLFSLIAHGSLIYFNHTLICFF